MKKIICLAIIAVMALTVLSVCAFAAPTLSATEQKILDEISAKITASGKEVALDAEWINYAKNYMLKEDVDITEAQSEEILGYVEEAKEIASTATVVTDKKAFDSEVNKKIIAVAAKAAEVVDVKLTVEAGNKVVFTDNTTNTVIAESTKTIKDTGAVDVNVMPVVVLATLMLLAGAGAVCVKKYEL